MANKEEWQARKVAHRPYASSNVFSGTIRMTFPLPTTYAIRDFSVSTNDLPDEGICLPTSQLLQFSSPFYLLQQHINLHKVHLYPKIYGWSLASSNFEDLQSSRSINRGYLSFKTDYDDMIKNAYESFDVSKFLPLITIRYRRLT